MHACIHVHFGQANDMPKKTLTIDQGSRHHEGFSYTLATNECWLGVLYLCATNNKATITCFPLSYGSIPIY